MNLITNGCIEQEAALVVIIW